MNLGQISREAARHTNIPVVSLPKLGGEMHNPDELIFAVEEYL
jgi:2-oxoglutarate ferredoxin oxidoreductase subunit alpha